MVGEEEEPTLLYAVVRKEARPPAAEVALPLAVIEYFNLVRRLAGVALLHDGVCQFLTFHRLHELGRQANTISASCHHRDKERGVPFKRGIRRWLELAEAWPGRPPQQP
jgi:hypothetical protein